MKIKTEKPKCSGTEKYTWSSENTFVLSKNTCVCHSQVTRTARDLTGGWLQTLVRLGTLRPGERKVWMWVQTANNWQQSESAEPGSGKPSLLPLWVTIGLAVGSELNPELLNNLWSVIHPGYEKADLLLRESLWRICSQVGRVVDFRVPGGETWHSSFPPRNCTEFSRILCTCQRAQSISGCSAEALHHRPHPHK